MPTWLHMLGCLALGECSHHRDYLGHEDVFCTVFLCSLATSSSYLLLLLGTNHFCPLLSPSLHETFPWYLISLKRSLIYPILLFSSISLHWSLREAFLSPCYSLELYIQMSISFLLSFAYCFSFHSYLKGLLRQSFFFFFFYISFSWGWSWSLPPVQCHEPLSIVHQALCLSDLVS